MANLTPGNENIYQLLSQHNFTLIDKKIDKYKCIICQRILINAYQAFCGCHYCEKCVDEQMRSGVVFCPGDTGECKMATLSSVAINHRMNRQISQLVVKCPEEMCCYESELRNMGDHLRLCGKSVECPFTDFGCDQGQLKRDELNEHLQQKSYRHIEILIDVIGNLRNELAELKRDREKYDAAIDKLVKSDREKAVMIDSMREEIQSMKLEKAVLDQRVDNLGNIFDGKADKTVLEQRIYNLGNILDGKADKRTLGQRVNNLGNILDGKVDKIVAEIEEKLEEMRREWRGAMEQQQFALVNVEERNEVKYRTEIAKRIFSVEKCLAEKIDADFVMTIDNIAENRQKGGNVYSKYFNGCTEPYKMQLGCHFYGSEFRISFRIYCGDSDESLQWPFDRNVTIAITNQKPQNAHKAITHHCTIANPSKSKYKYYYNDAFKFQWNELSDEGLLHDDRFTVQCIILN